MEKSDTKGRLLNLAREKFIKFGYKNVKTDDLAKELGISKRTIYEMYPSKDEMLIEAIKLEIAEFEENMDGIARKMIEGDRFTFFEHFSSLWDMTIHHTSVFTSEFYEEIKRHLPQFYSACKRHDFKRFDNFQKVFNMGVRHGYIKQGIDNDLFLKLTHGAMLTLLNPDFLSVVPLSIDQVIKQAFKILFTGILTDSGKENFEETARKYMSKKLKLSNIQ